MAKADEQNTDVEKLTKIAEDIKKLADQGKKNAAKNGGGGSCADEVDGANEAELLVAGAAIAIIVAGRTGDRKKIMAAITAFFERANAHRQALDAALRCLSRNRDDSKSDFEKRQKKFRDLLGQLEKEKDKLEKGR